MLTIHRDRHYTFRFADGRLIPRFHLEGVEAGRRLQGFNINRVMASGWGCSRPRVPVPVAGKRALERNDR